MIAIIDYGAGNLFSVKNALDYLNIPNIITDNPQEMKKADKLILPGVGAFPMAMKKLKEKNLVEVLKEQAKQKPLLGICLGMQLLFEEGFEFGQTQGLGLIQGKVDTIVTEYKIPHMGYNELEKNMESPLLAGISEGDWVYFVHSYMVYTAPENVGAYCEYGGKIPAIVQDNKYVYGAQFHPEKSGDTGIQILKNFGQL
jgi:imidazole glycerol phosphate synthase, glutamine amidotransferase subunit